jgi:hypothetical protein
MHGRSNETAITVATTTTVGILTIAGNLVIRFRNPGRVDDDAIGNSVGVPRPAVCQGQCN